jgi:geranylgeranyl diphosphate synthase, type I
VEDSVSATSSLERLGPGGPDQGQIVPFPAGRSDEVQEHLRRVDLTVQAALADLAGLWQRQLDESGLAASAESDLLGHSDLPQLIAELAGAGGKRLRPVMSYLGWVSAGGRRRGVGLDAIVRAGAALELLHLFALVHDDVMDESDSRRGRPAVHVRARALHEASSARGCPQRFGESIAVLLGDLAHAEADHLAGQLPDPMPRIWRALVVELVCGQRFDLTGSAGGRHDLAHARHVARSKSGAYTVERPLQLGAAAAGASEVVTATLRTYGRELGEAFALRDDLLGVWGDPTRTGKPVGDDLVSGKPTVLMALAHERLGGSAAARLCRVSSGDGGPAEVAALLEDLEREGLRTEVEDRIDAHVRAALRALENPELHEDGTAQLRRMAAEVAWRDR